MNLIRNMCENSQIKDQARELWIVWWISVWDSMRSNSRQERTRQTEVIARQNPRLQRGRDDACCISDSAEGFLSVRVVIGWKVKYEIRSLPFKKPTIFVSFVTWTRDKTHKDTHEIKGDQTNKNAQKLKRREKKITFFCCVKMRERSDKHISRCKYTQIRSCTN